MKVPTAVATFLIFLVSGASWALADAFILNFDDPLFADPSSPEALDRSQRPVDGAAGALGPNEVPSLPGTLRLGITTLGSGAERSDGLGLPRPASDEPVADSGSFGVPSIAAPDSDLPTVQPEHVLISRAAGEACAGRFCAEPNGDPGGPVVAFDFSAFMGGVSLQTIDIIELELGAASDRTVGFGLLDGTGRQPVADPVVEGARPAERRAIDDDDAIRLDLHQFFSGNAGVGRN